MDSDRDVTGVVASGRGKAAPVMRDPQVLARVREVAGFEPVPGTLNVHVRGFDRRVLDRYLSAPEINPGWELVTGHAGYFFALVLVAGRYRGLAFQADEPDYPGDLVELDCEVHLRDALGLRDGDTIGFSILGTDG
jgi:CTP-dependent riboflavin kinase